MPRSSIIRHIAQKGSDKKVIAQRAVRKPDLLDDVVGGLGARETRVRLGCASVLTLVSETNPELLESRTEVFIGMLDHESTVLRWNATRILANLARTDTSGWLDLNLDRYLAPVTGKELIAAANAIAGSAAIAIAKPQFGDRIAAELLKVQSARYKTPECRNVALGHVVRAFDRFFDQLARKEEPLDLIRRLRRNPRAATRKKAAEFLRKRGLQRPISAR